MPSLSYAQLSKNLSNSEVAPLVLLYGDENFLINDSIELIKKIVLEDDLDDFNLDILYGDSIETSTLSDTIETLPMMNTRRLIIVKEAQQIKEKQWAEILKILSRPIESSVVVFCMSKVDKRKKYFKLLQQSGVVVEFKRPREDQIPHWIVSIARKHDLNLDSDAVNLMHQFVGSHLDDLDSEMLKLSQYMNERREVRGDDIIEVVSRVRVESIFELTAAIGRQDRIKALLCLANLLDHGQSEVGALALVSRHLKIIKAIKYGAKEGLTGAQLTSRAGIQPYFLRQYQDQSRIWSEKKLENGFKALLQTDRALKSSPLSSHIWLENFILQVCD